MAVIMVLMAMGARTFPSGSKNRVLHEAAKLAVVCEVAAQHAKASNRWVYLFFKENEANGEVTIAMVADRDGGDPFSTELDRNTSDAGMEVLHRNEKLSQIRLSTLENGLFEGRTLEHSGQTFNSSLRFSPTGQVEADPLNFVSAIRIGLLGATERGDEPPLVIEVAALTSMTQILQP